MGIRSAALPLLVAMSASSAAQARDLREFYRERCLVCHGADGTGRGPNGVRLGGRNLADGRWFARQEDAALATSILKGRGAMPGFGRQLSEGEARRLVAEVLRPMVAHKKP
ncbi:c-type cytochrome [Geothrix paludis]|uniref:c-type cytochrome n=1 Tax=Geothrix paludis TaxID=2922722 RepID=UPI001FAB8819|nr:cytochrome c [Geothrix paludis]